jgi:hypothetical protein
MRTLPLSRVFLYGFIVSFAIMEVLLGLLIVIPATFAGLLGPSNGADFFLLVGLLSTFTGLFFGVVTVVLYYVWRAIPVPAQVAIVILLLLVGTALAQLELDVVAILGIMLTALGVKGAPGHRGGR